MSRVKALPLFALLVLTACGESTPSNQQKAAGTSPPVRIACTTPEQAGAKAGDITRKLVEAKKAGKITQDEYDAFNVTMGQGLQAWSERQDLTAYCSALDRIVKGASLQ
ncbi:MAG: hypothetical protein K8S25_07220 [Alphaproteobacteria bacterium]|nr:hypothetical protein [Alphaproteobacteria bacterium]MCE9522208.1 hypothetical protein [Alphaproteobacteria bacterium]